jgi:hypothetical protein
MFFVLCNLIFIIKSLVENDINYFFYLGREMKGDLFIAESWVEVTAWVKEV